MEKNLRWMTKEIPATNRIRAKGKFLFDGEEKFYIKGVTYGTFKPQPTGDQYPESSVIENDFRLMADRGINCVRTYTIPTRQLLDIALKYGLKIMAGLPWEQHITFLDTEERKKDIIRRIQEGVLLCREHPAVFCFAIGNEIPAPIVRWYGKEKIEDFLEKLFKAVKAVDPSCLVTYVNFPTTEYLDLSFLDFYCFNVYLETPQKLSAYLSRLHNLAGNKPLVLAEIGLDSLRNGTALQAETLAWQIETVFAGGSAGMFVFAWTDEWWRGGFDIEDWDFGLVDRHRNPKPALYAVSEALLSIPFSDEEMPFITVVVCSYNGAATIGNCISTLLQLDYPEYEIIVVNDGSTDNTAEIVKEYPVQLISTTNCGLSSARNTGLYHAKGEIVAYIDDDAYPDLQWLKYLAFSYKKSIHAGIGGPNIAPGEDGPIAKCVANAPGGPVHVLLSDEVAEHIPGCNMSFRTHVLKEAGGFDPVYRSAGDDVDICWRIQALGHTIGFNPGAVVWHHRRNSLKAYWNQQKGYGKAEAQLEAKWPEKYNGMGHLAWSGRIYGNGFTLPIKFRKDKIFYGTWGTALFQSIYQPANGFLAAIPLMPEWYLFILLLALVASMGGLWAPLLWLWPLWIASIAVVFIQAFISASDNVSLQSPQKANIKYKVLIIALHLVQPLARLYGRLAHGLTPWRKRGAGLNLSFLFVFRPQHFSHWSEEWRSTEDWLGATEKALKDLKVGAKRGGDFDKWDLQVKNGLFTAGRCLLVIEEHGGGKQYLKLRCWLRYSTNGILLFCLLAALVVGSALDSEWIVSLITGTGLLLMLSRYVLESAVCMNTLYSGFKSLSTLEPATIPLKEAIPEESVDDDEELERALEEMGNRIRPAYLQDAVKRGVDGASLNR
jgi:glycosyltransferase involved in cell wall biosynthesis